MNISVFKFYIKPEYNLSDDLDYLLWKFYDDGVWCNLCGKDLKKSRNFGNKRVAIIDYNKYDPHSEICYDCFDIYMFEWYRTMYELKWNILGRNKYGFFVKRNEYPLPSKIKRIRYDDEQKRVNEYLNEVANLLFLCN